MSTANRNGGIWGWLAVLAAICMLIGHAQATNYTWYVDAAATGNNSGTNWANACTNIQGGIDASWAWLQANTPSGTRDELTVGDAMYVIVRAGTYVENVTVASYSGYRHGPGGSKTPFYLQSEDWATTGKWSTIIKGPGTAADSALYFLAWYWNGLGGFGNWYVRGFTIRADQAGFGAGGGSQYGLNVNGCHGTVENNVIEVVNANNSWSWNGIYGIANSTIRSNIIRKLGSGGTAPLSCIEQNGDNNEIYDNLIVLYGNNLGAHWDAGAIHAATTVSNNRIHHNVVMGMPGGYQPYVFVGFPGYNWTGATKTNEFYANIFYYTGGRMVDMGNTTNGGQNTAFYNNTFYSGSGYIHCYSDPDTFFNNVIVSAGDIYFDGFDHTAVLGYDNMNNGTNYFRPPATVFVTTDLPSGWTNKLPSELRGSGWLQLKNPTIQGLASLDGYATSGTDVYGVRSHTGPQMGAVYIIQRGTTMLFR